MRNKFRAWDTKTESYVEHGFDFRIDGDGYIYRRIWGESEWQRTSDLIIEYSTGLKDKHGKGKEIYASDTLSSYDGVIKYFAYWDAEQGQWWGRCVQTETTKAYHQTLPLWEILDRWHMEIIGTIHNEDKEDA